MKTFNLNNGLTIPSIGFGTWQIEEGEKAYEAVLHAIKCGHRHIDTAAAYGNEKSIGRAIKDSGVAREELFITTKVWNTERGYEKTTAAFEHSLNLLGLDYIDLYLIHWPANSTQFPEDWKELNLSTWKAMEDLYANDKIKSIGVSNFMVKHLEALIPHVAIPPMVNQIEYHPGYLQNDVVEFCQKNSILVEAWSPIGSGRILENELLKSIAEKYSISVAQLCIAFALGNNVLPLPKSATPKNIESNLSIDQVVIHLEDMKKIESMPLEGFTGLNPDEVDF